MSELLKLMDVNKSSLLNTSLPRFPQDASSELKPYQPDTRETISNWVYDKARRYGLPANQYRKKTSFLLDFIPGLGDYLGAEDAVNDYQNGQYLKSAIGGGLTALGVVVGPAKGLVKQTKSKADEAIDALEQMLSDSEVGYQKYAKEMQPTWDAQKAANDKISDGYRSNVDSGLWGRQEADEATKRIGGDRSYLKEAINHANLKGVADNLSKEGWQLRHTSNQDGVISSQYLVSPDGEFEIRLSDHQLPLTAQREHSRQYNSARWDDELVLSGNEKPSDIIDEIKEQHSQFVRENGYLQRLLK